MTISIIPLHFAYFLHHRKIHYNNNGVPKIQHTTTHLNGSDVGYYYFSTLHKICFKSQEERAKWPGVSSKQAGTLHVPGRDATEAAPKHQVRQKRSTQIHDQTLLKDLL